MQASRIMHWGTSSIHPLNNTPSFLFLRSHSFIMFLELQREETLVVQPTWMNALFRMDSMYRQKQKVCGGQWKHARQKQRNAILPSTCFTQRSAYLRVFTVEDLFLCLLSAGRWSFSSFSILITSFWVLALADSWLLQGAQSDMHSGKSDTDTYRIIISIKISTPRHHLFISNAGAL